MKKSYYILLLIIALGIFEYLAPFYFEGSFIDPNEGVLHWGVISLVFIVLTLVALFAEFENFATSAKQIALISMLGTVSGISRIPFAAAMNFQPCTFFIICSGYVFGPMAGFMVGALTAIISNLFLGHGPWTAYQIFTWGLIGIFSGFLGKIPMPSEKYRIALLVPFGILAGVMYAMIINTWFMALYRYPHNVDVYKGVLYTATFWTISHSAANAFFLIVLGNKVINVMDRFKIRFFWTWEGSRDKLQMVPETAHG